MSFDPIDDQQQRDDEGIEKMLAEERAADAHTRWEEQGRPVDPPEDERESCFDDDNGGGPEFFDD